MIEMLAGTGDTTMRWMMAALATILIAAGGASAAPSCRDSKGLYTPCVGERVPGARPHRHRVDAAPTVASDDGTPRVAAPPHRTRPPLFDRGRSCRDSKGLFTPCPR